MGVDDEHVKGMRWLYDDEKSYRKAVAKLKLEELKAQKEKALIKQYRKRQRRLFIGRVRVKTQKLTDRVEPYVTKKRAMYSGIAVCGLIALLVGSTLVRHSRNPSVTSLGQNIQPDFKPVLPKDTPKNVITLQNNDQKITSYQHSFNGVQILVSQQKLPESFAKDQSAVENLANTAPFRGPDSTLEAIDTTKGKLYVVTYSSGSQRAVMKLPTVLIFFQTTTKLDTSGWFDYVDQLQVK